MFFKRKKKHIVELVDEKNRYMYSIHAQSNVCNELVKIFCEDWEKGKGTDDLVLGPGGCVEER